MYGERTITMTVQETAKLLGVSPQCVRVGLESGAFQFGTVVKMKRKVYVIYRSEVEKLTGKRRENGSETEGRGSQETSAEGAD